MKIEKYFDQTTPIISISDGVFEIEILDNDIYITCDWDSGWYGTSSGIEKIIIPLDIFEEIIKEYRELINDNKKS
jgi:hypothetical protein